MLTAQSSSRDAVETARWPALGTNVVLRVAQAHVDVLDQARRIVEAELDAIDRACSRFRPDSELERLNACAGRFVTVGPLLMEAIQVAVRAAALTDGAVDPTLGEAIVLAGYSRDWSELERRPGAPPAPLTVPSGAVDARRPVLRARRTSGWSLIELGYDPPGVRVPAGVRFDLGATAKALAADRAAAAVHAATGAGVLVSLGGDIATAGPAEVGGWAVHVTDDHRAGPDAPGQTVAIETGGLATSSTTVRRWQQGARVMHHILDPATGQPVAPVWRTASVAAASCVDANIASTAAIVQGYCAIAWLNQRGLPARLVGAGGEVHVLAGWPDDPLSATQ
jgi:FAD:protein FMN transferase